MGFYAVNYVENILTEYDASQPENIMSGLVGEISSNGFTEELESYVILPELNQNTLDKEISIYDMFLDEFVGLQSCEYTTGASSESGQSYWLMVDGEKIAIVNLVSSNEKTQLGILKTMDWELESIQPIITLNTYDYTINTPEDFLVYVNDTMLAEPVVVDNQNVYTLSKFYTEPTIHIYDGYGIETDFNIADNVVTSVFNTFDITVPEVYRVSVNSKPVFGTTVEGGVEYHIETACESVNVEDKYGNNIEYTGSGELVQYERQIEVPNSYSVLINGESADSFVSDSTVYDEFKYCEEYTEIPYGLIYTFDEFLADPEITIVNNLGEEVYYDVSSRLFKTSNIAGSNEVPAIFSEDNFDPWEMAKTWNLFMTDDIGGSDNGFSVMKKYLIKDSYMYNVAYKWTTGIDITLTSAHRTSDNYFEEEWIGNFKKYSDEFYSFDVHMVKYMYLYKSNRWVDDIMNSRFYVIRDNKGTWRIVDIQEIIDK